MSNREQFEAFLISEYDWAEGALNTAIFCGDDATGHYVCGEHIYDKRDCSECLFWAWRGWQAASKASEQQLAAVVAENAGLKSAFDKPQAYLSWHAIPPTWEDPLPCGEYLDVHDEAGHKNSDGTDCWPVFANPEIKTPATDACLAEVRAQGVEMFADMTDKVADEEEFYDNGESFDSLKYTAKQARLFAAQLRQGAAL